MSLYARGWLYTVWMVVVLCTFPYWIALLQAYLGGVGVLVGMAIWLGHGMLALYAFACPTCDLSIYRGSHGLVAINQPWPRRTCGHCGRNHASRD